MRDPQDDLEQLEAQGLRRFLQTFDSPQGREMIANSAEFLNFSSNDYLGFANDSQLKEQFREAIGFFGTGSGASRLICGTMRPHEELEKKIAALKKAEAALTFSSGFAAATGAIPAIVGKNDYVILDKLCHASLIDGVRLSGATFRVFRHNGMDQLRSRLEWAHRQGKERSGSRILVVTESVFSMDGDRTPLSEICELKNSAGALLWLDEAHGFGVLGPKGRGLAAELGLEEQVDFQMGTFSKAAGLSGGYLCASQDWIDLITNRARSFIYSTSPAPALAQTICGALDLVCGPEGERRREQLWENIAILRNSAGSAIVPLVIGENEAALATAQRLRDRGFWIPAIRYPTVPKGSARLRITVSAAHQRSDLVRLRSELGELGLMK